MSKFLLPAQRTYYTSHSSLGLDASELVLEKVPSEGS